MPVAWSSGTLLTLVLDALPIDALPLDNKRLLGAGTTDRSDQMGLIFGINCIQFE